MYENVGASLPREFFYNLSKLQGSMSKNKIRINADRPDGNQSGTIVNFRLPIGSLLQLQSLSLFWKASMSGTNPAHPTRYAQSFIKRLSISVNNVNIQQIEDFGLLYNLMADHTNKDRTKTIGGDFADNSVIYTETNPTGSAQTAITAQNTLLAATTNQSNIKMKVNNFLGFLGSSTTSILPTDRLGEVVISITLAQPYEVLGGSAEASSATYTNNSYTLDDMYLTCEALSFSDDSYYNSINNKDLMFGFNDYVVTKFAPVSKTTGINVTNYLSANSIDWVCGTAIVAQSQPKTMVAYGGDGDGASANVINMFKYLSDPVTYVNNNSGNTGDGFFGVEALKRDLQGLETSQFSINNKTLNYAAYDQHEVYQSNLDCLGYEGVDASANGWNPAITSLPVYFKYYGGHFQSLSLVDKEQFLISGLSSAGSSCAINWACKFKGNSTYDITPVLIAKLSKVLHVKSGRMVFVE
jgi:hypothetical protein